MHPQAWSPHPKLARRKQLAAAEVVVRFYSDRWQLVTGAVVATEEEEAQLRRFYLSTLEFSLCRYARRESVLYLIGDS